MGGIKFADSSCVLDQVWGKVYLPPLTPLPPWTPHFAISSLKLHFRGFAPSKPTLQPFWSHSGLQGLIWTHFGPPGIDLKAFRPPRLDLELFKAPGLDFAAIWASSAWFGTTCGTSQGSIWNNLSLQR